MSVTEYFRNCPICKKVLYYKSAKSLYNAKWAKTPCNSCTQKGHVAWNKGLSKESNHSVKKYADAMKKSWDKSKIDNSRIVWNSGLTALGDSRVKDNIEKTRQTLLKLHTENKIEVWNKGKPFPRMSGENSPTKRHEVRAKMRESANKNRIRLGTFRTWFNPKACELFDVINKEMKWEGIHAMNNNGVEYHIKGLGYYVDFYEPKLNIVIEYYEKSHNKTKVKNRDVVRQKQIEEKINCTFYIIKQTEEHLWRQTIQKESWLQGV